MAITVSELLEVVGLGRKKIRTVKWGKPIRDENKPKGIYFISTSEDPNENSSLFAKAPIDDEMLRFWINKVPKMRIDNNESNPSIHELRNRISAFWLADENILYIGSTTRNIGKRIQEYYDTELGDPEPHSGGHWLKTLKDLDKLYVHYVSVEKPKEEKEKLLKAFSDRVSKDLKDDLYDPLLPLPFANIELKSMENKKHGISKSRI